MDAMVFSYVLSWLANTVAIGVVVAIVAEGKGYNIERKPIIPFALAAGLPALLELVSFIFENKPFLALIWPAFGSLF
jgi:hypothetical protein